MSRTYKWQMALCATLLGAVAALAAQGCTVTTSNSPIDGGDFLPPLPNSCNDCLYQQCNGQYAACAQNADCYAIYTCSIQCDVSQSGTCVQNCFDQRPAGQATYLSLGNCDNYVGCAGGTCFSSCTATPLACNTDDDAGTGGPPDATVTLSCDQCTSTSCSAFKATCTTQNSECDLYSQCSLSCASQADVADCANACASAHQQGQSDYVAYGNCTTTSCHTECGF